MFDFQKILDVMGPIQLSVVAVLGTMATLSIAVFVERNWVYWRSRKNSRRFGATAARFLVSRDYAQFERVATKERGNQLALLLGAGMRRYRKAGEEKSADVGPVELTKRELERQADTISAQLRRGLNVLASVGSTAPFVGLLGTVIGIIAAFQSLDAEGMNLEKLSGAIGEALVVTALGLMVAIPAVLMYNFLSARADNLELLYDLSRGEFVDHIEAHHSLAEAEAEAARFTESLADFADPNQSEAASAA